MYMKKGEMNVSPVFYHERKNSVIGEKVHQGFFRRGKNFVRLNVSPRVTFPMFKKNTLENFKGRGGEERGRGNYILILIMGGQ